MADQATKMAADIAASSTAGGTVAGGAPQGTPDDAQQHTGGQSGLVAAAAALPLNGAGGAAAKVKVKHQITSHVSPPPAGPLPSHRVQVAFSLVVFRAHIPRASPTYAPPWWQISSAILCSLSF